MRNKIRSFREDYQNKRSVRRAYLALLRHIESDTRASRKIQSTMSETAPAEKPAVDGDKIEEILLSRIG